MTGHPAGSDLIYWPEEEIPCTPEGLAKPSRSDVKANALPGFNPRFYAPHTPLRVVKNTITPYFSGTVKKPAQAGFFNGR
ncbi:bacteriocin immunity protein [Pseudomonas taetrolens]|nr:bacteriocin immunity protein [Pseudomonas taetrolens]